jgi:hypothetical protein
VTNEESQLAALCWGSATSLLNGQSRLKTYTHNCILLACVPAALPGWGVICIVLPCQYLFGWMIIKNKIKNAENTQARGGIIQELLPAMKLVKYYAW